MRRVFQRISKDVRVPLFGFFAILLMHAITDPAYGRSWQQWLALTMVCVGTDLLLTRGIVGCWRFPLSGLISSVGIFLIIDSPFIWPYMLAGGLAIGSKYFVVINKKHIFNPGNFAILLVLYGFPDFVATSGFRWAGDVYWSAVLLLFGIAIAHRAQRLRVALAYYLVFVIVALFKFSFLEQNLLHLILILFGPATQLFIFFMITDPKTSPGVPVYQWWYGGFIAIIDGWLKWLENKNAPLLALLIVCGVIGFMRILEPMRGRRVLLKKAVPTW